MGKDLARISRPSLMLSAFVSCRPECGGDERIQIEDRATFPDKRMQGIHAAARRTDDLTP
jgi:hypothetical protein